MYSPVMYKKYVGFMAIANTLQFLKISFEDTKNICNHIKNESVTARQNQVRKKCHSSGNFIEHYGLGFFKQQQKSLFHQVFNP